MKKLTYQYAEQMAEGEESPILTLVECSCNDEDFEALYSQIQSIAYNGEVTVEDDVEPEPEPEPTQLDRVEAQAVYTAMMTDTLLEV